jgi:hypothetical protein
MRKLAVLGLLALAGSLALPWSPAGGEVPEDVAVISSQGVAGVIGLVSRVPAESPGGAVFTRSSINLDKTVAQGAAFTLGELAETFFTTSSEDYRNPVLVSAQHPPSAAVRDEASFDGGQEAPAGSPVSGRVGSIRAKATGQPWARAEATGAALAHEVVSVGSGTSSSLSELRADGTLVTRVEGVAEDVRIGDVLTIAQARSVSETVVPAVGQPSARLEVTISGARAGGVPVEITSQGVRVADATVVPPEQLAALNSALAALAAQGITVAGVPAEQEVAGNTARASGAALVVRYSVAPQIGGDEEIRLAPVAATVTIERRELGPLPSLELPPPPPSIAESAVPAAVPDPIPYSSGSPVADGLEPATAPPGLELAGPAYPLAPVVPVATTPALGLTVQPSDPGAGPLRTAYGIVVLCAFLGAGLLVVRMNARLV